MNIYKCVETCKNEYTLEQSCTNDIPERPVIPRTNIFLFQEKITLNEYNAE